MPSQQQPHALDDFATTQREAPFTTHCRSCRQNMILSADEHPAVLSEPIVHLLESNCPPSDSESDIITAAISERAYLLEALDTQISALDATIRSLQELRKARSKELNSLRAVKSKMRTFPAEILYRIFEECVDGIINHLSYEGFRMLNPTSVVPSLRNAWSIPWSLAAVCRRWRDIAISYDKLWSFVRCLLNQPSEQIPYLTEKARSRITLQLERSSSHPLSLLVSWLQFEEPSDDSNLADLLSESSRWENVYLWISRFPVRVNRERLTPSMRALHIIGHLNEDTRLIFPGPFGSPITFPRLHHLSMSVHAESIDFLSKITAPGLLTFRMILIDLQNQWPLLSCISRFLQRSECPLEVFELQFSSYHRKGINYRHFLNTIPTKTRELALQFGTTGNVQVFKELTTRHDLLPGLESLTLYGQIPSNMLRSEQLHTARPALKICLPDML